MLAWLKGLFGKPRRRQARYVMNLTVDNRPGFEVLEEYRDILRRHTPVISAREYGKLPAELRLHFVRVGKPDETPAVSFHARGWWGKTK